MKSIRLLQAFRCTSSMELCTTILRADSRLELHVHFCIQAGYHADDAPWGVSPGCTRTQFTRTHTSTVSHRREHATARTHTHTPQGRQLATISLKHVTGSLPAPASGSGSQGAKPFAATASVPLHPYKGCFYIRNVSNSPSRHIMCLQFRFEQKLSL